ncbi:MAG: PAS domain S-box protein [Proteobacteria bacterium]|nr:PAS domain S-box protein [Pseudomonadota bacterium]MBU1648712.1 PAS domain S-box protein [Pseudomonadota bacterium]
MHQIKLEVQNEELCRAQDVLIAKNKRIQDLYDQDPIGYFSLSDQYLILDANSTAHTLLGRDRGKLLHQPFTRFILPEEQDLFSLFRTRLIETNNSENLDVRMVRADGSSVWVRLNVKCIQPYDNNDIQFYRAAITDISDMKQIEETLLFLAHHIPGESFFTSLARHLAQALNIDFVCINSLDGDGLSAQTLAVYHNGEFKNNVRHALKDTPCGEVVGKEICCFPADVCHSFPQDEFLKDLRAESFVGVTLWSSSGQPIGLIAVIDHQPLANQSQVEAMLKLVAVRAAGELERLTITNALMASEKLYALTCSAVNDGLWEWPIPSGKGFFSTRYYEMLGYNDGEFPADYATWRTLVHPQDIDRVEEELWQNVEMGKRFLFDLRIKKKSGEWLWVCSRGKVIEQDSAGKGLRMLGTMTDITNRKEAEHALQKHNETYRDILSTAFDGFWLVDFQGNILDVNESYCRQSGYSREELLSMHPYELDVTETEADTADHIRRIIESGTQSMFETIHRRKDGSTWNVEISVGLSNKAGGQFVAFLRDITARKMAEKMIVRSLQEKKVLVQELRKRIKVHVRVIEDVISLQASLARSLQEKKVLLQEVHHRVKNNLQVVHSVLSLQARRVADSETRLLFDGSINRIHTMSLLHERLCHAKDLGSIDFNNYLKSLIDVIVSTYPYPHITCVVETEPVFLDLTTGTPCGLIAHELITNSIIHAFPDGRVGTISVGMHKPSPGFIVLTVEDNGIGFRPNFKASSSSSLGMQIVNGLTTQIHGTIDYSTADGTKVCVSFPEKFARNYGVTI